MDKIKEIIVVEGRDDTRRIKEAVVADTLETRGSAIDKSILALIAKAQETRGVIVFTDPDSFSPGPGASRPGPACR